MSTKTNLIIDATMFGALLVVANPHLTAGTVHKWLAVSLTGVVITHLLLHWEWVVKVGKEFFKKLFHQSRLNFVVNSLFFIAMTGALFSGLMISESVLATLGIQLDVSRSWKMIHSLTSDLSVVLLGVHAALHWKWITNSIGRYIVNPIRGLSQPRTAPQPMLPNALQTNKSR